MIPPLASTGSPGAPELRKTVREFESVFLHLLLKSMRATVREAGVPAGGRGRALFTDLLDQALAGSAAARGLGLEELLARRYAPAPGPGRRLDVLSGGPGRV